MKVGTTWLFTCWVVTKNHPEVGINRAMTKNHATLQYCIIYSGMFNHVVSDIISINKHEANNDIPRKLANNVAIIISSSKWEKRKESILDTV